MPLKSLKSQNFYDILGVARHASPEEIRSAYEISRHTFQENSLATYSLFSDQENHEILGLIAKAFETLFNPETRRAYDAQLGLSDGGTPAAPRRAPTPYGVPSASPAAGAQGAPAAPPGLQAAARPRTEAEPPRRTAVPPGHAPETRAPQPPPPRGVAVPIFQPTPATRPPSASTPAASKPVPVPESPPPNPVRDEYIKTIARYDGAVLRRLRQIQGMSLEELAERSKIRRAYLEYIEEENFQFLPAAVYVKGFVTLMATIFGAPSQRVAEDYMQIFKAKRP